MRSRRSANDDERGAHLHLGARLLIFLESHHRLAPSFHSTGFNYARLTALVTMSYMATQKNISLSARRVGGVAARARLMREIAKTKSA